jgi:hypothetical protein
MGQCRAFSKIAKTTKLCLKSYSNSSKTLRRVRQPEKVT